MQPTLSVIVPCYNEEQVIHETHGRLSRVLTALDITYEIIYINDGSRDGTLNILKTLQNKNPAVRVISFSRNFGHQTAVTAGVDRASGKAVALIDADLQDPPEVLAQMLEKWREGYHVVYGQRLSRKGESTFKLFTAHLFYRLINRLSETPIPLDTGDFRLMDRKAVEALKSMPERHRFVRGMISWVGFKQIALPYERMERFAGESKYPLSKMLAFATDGILSFSGKPLVVSTTIGLLTSCLALLGIIYALVLRLFTSIWVSGFTLLFISVLFMGGVQLICLGIIGQYISRIYSESKQRPLYLIEEELGFEQITPPEQSILEPKVAKSKVS